MDIVDAKSKYESGLREFDAGRFLVALKIFSELLTHFPTRPSIVDGLMACQIRMGLYADGLETLDHFQASGGSVQENPDIALKAAICARNLGDAASAQHYLHICELSHARAKEDSLRFAIKLEGVECCRSAGKISDALQFLESIETEFCGKEFRSLISLQRASLLVDLCDYSAAIELLQAWQFVTPSSQLILASALVGLSRYHEASRVLEGIRQSCMPGDVDHLHATARLLSCYGEAGAKESQRELYLSLSTEVVRAMVDLEGPGIFMVLRGFGDWSVDIKYASLANERDRFRFIKAGRSPFISLSVESSPSLHREIAENLLAPHIQENMVRSSRVAHGGTPSISRQRPQVALLSGDFRQHAVAELLSGLFVPATSRGYDLAALCTIRPDESPVARGLLSNLDEVVNCESMSDHELASHLERFSVVIDLAGHTKGSRLRAVSMAAQNVKVINWLGYPGTVGTGVYEGVLLDGYLKQYVTPSDFAEKRLLSLDTRCYQPPGSRDRYVPDCERLTTTARPFREFVFGCLNNPYKISYRDLECWQRILGDVKNSRLALLSYSDLYERNMINVLCKAGFCADSIFFLRATTIDSYLRYFQQIDLFLDTALYGAHTTASDALFMGCPIIPHQGGTAMQSLVSSSILHHAGLGELIPNNTDAYINFAIEVASDFGLYRQLKDRFVAAAAGDFFDLDRYREELSSLITTLSR